MNWEEEREKQTLDFFNGARNVGEIVDALKDDPDLGSDSPLAHGRRSDTAERILQIREKLGGEFTSIEQIDQFRGVGPYTLHDIYHSLSSTSQSYPVLLFPVRIETRFIENDLLVRIYPNDIHIQRHDARLMLDELDTLKQYQKEIDETEIKDVVGLSFISMRTSSQ